MSRLKEKLCAKLIAEGFKLDYDLSELVIIQTRAGKGWLSAGAFKWHLTVEGKGIDLIGSTFTVSQCIKFDFIILHNPEVSHSVIPEIAVC